MTRDEFIIAVVGRKIAKVVIKDDPRPTRHSLPRTEDDWDIECIELDNGNKVYFGAGNENNVYVELETVAE